MNKTVETVRESRLPEQFALVAFQQGVIDAAQLRQAVRVWIDSAPESIEQVLVEQGFVSDSDHHKLTGYITELHSKHAHLKPPFFGPESTVEDDSEAFQQGKSFAEEGVEDILSRKSSGSSQKKRRSKPKETVGFDYYDSVHQHFTTDDRLLPFLLGQLKSVPRRFRQQLHRIGRSSVGLAEIVLYWLKSNLRYVLMATGCLGLIFGGISLASWLNGNSETQPGGANSDSTSRTVSPPGFSNSALTRSAATSADDAAQDIELELEDQVDQELTPEKSIPSKLAVDPDALDSDLRVETVSATSPLEVDEVQTVNASIADALFGVGASASTEQTSDDIAEMGVEVGIGEEAENRERRNELIEQAVALVSQEQPLVAVELLQQSLASEKEVYDVADVHHALAAAFFAAKQFDEGGEVLVTNELADGKNERWELLLTCWLLYASEDSRVEIGDRLRRISSTRPTMDPLHRVLAWIRARNRNSTEAITVLSTKPIFGERTFGDALFYSVALRYENDRANAVVQLKDARSKFENRWRDQSSHDEALHFGSTIQIIDKALGTYAASLNR